MSQSTQIMQRALAEAYAFQRMGRLGEAERRCRELLKQAPDEPEALYFLGLLLAQSARFAEAAAVLGKAAARLRGQYPVVYHLAESQRLAGLLEEAEKSYRQALRLKPDAFEAHANLGALLLSRGMVAEATQELERAHRLNSQAVPVLISLAGLSLERGETERALEFARKAVAVSPHMAECHLALGNALAAQGEFDTAIAAYNEALRLHAGLAMAHFGIGAALKSKGDLPGAVAAYELCWRMDPENARAHNNLANCLRELGEDEQARQHYIRALALNTGYAEAHCGLAVLLDKQEDVHGAMECYERALAVNPDLEPAMLELARLAQKNGNPQRAVELCRRLLAKDPENAGLYLILGRALFKCGSQAEAQASLERVLLLRPDWVDGLNSLGLFHADLEHYARALEYYAEAMKIEPDNAVLHANAGLVLGRSGDDEAALRHFESAIGIEPGQAEAHFGLAQLLLKLGMFGSGWREYEWRYQSGKGKSYAPDPCRPGEMLPRPSSYLPAVFADRRLFLLWDQGIGDELFFLRFAPEFRRRGAWLAYRASAKLQDMLARSTELDQIVAADDYPRDIDYTFLVGEAPLVLGLQDTDPLPPPFPLAPLPDRVGQLRSRLAAIGAGPFLGVTWRAGTPPVAGGKAVLFKEVPLAELAQRLKEWPGHVLVLQRNPAPGEVEAFEAALGRKVYDFSEANEDLEEVLALLSLLDDYVGVSNTNVHLRAGLGKPCRVLIPQPPEWRWMAQGDESPWFPGFRLYRQASDRSWEEAMNGLAQDLAGNKH